MTSWSQGNSFTAAPGSPPELSLKECNHLPTKKVQVLTAALSPLVLFYFFLDYAIHLIVAVMKRYVLPWCQEHVQCAV
jgi:hypothetical protein